MIFKSAKNLWNSLHRLFAKNKISPNRSENQGWHLLKKTPDDRELCVGCGLCARVCPTDAIAVRAAANPEEYPISIGESYAETFIIDAGYCIFCGYCEETCPTQAIVLTSRSSRAAIDRQNLHWDKEYLLKRESN